MNNEKVFLKGYVVGHSADTLGYKGFQIQLENMDIVEVGKNLIYKIVDEPQKPVVPQFVADWIERSKQEKRNIRNALNNGGEKMRLWFLDLENYDIFVRAWLDGYEVEKEKRYYIRLKNVDENYNYLTCIKHLNAWVLTEIKRDKKFRTEHTKEQLEEGGFGEVFDSPLFEVEEVEG